MLSGLETFENRKNISFIEHWLMAWLSKKQNFMSLSIIEAQYIVVRICCMRLLWIKQMLKDYGIEEGTMNMHYDNSSAINISKNLVLHSHTNHIEFRNHFIKDLVEKNVVSLWFVLSWNFN